MPSERAATKCAAGGFTLVEVMASVAILAGVIVGLLVARASALQTCQLAQELMTCTRLCATQAAALRADLLGEGAGEFDSPKGYAWKTVREALPEDFPKGLQAFKITVLPPSRRDEAAVSVTVWRLEPSAGKGLGQ